MHKVKKYIAEDLKFSNQTIKEMKINSKKFYNKIIKWIFTVAVKLQFIN